MRLRGRLALLSLNFSDHELENQKITPFRAAPPLFAQDSPGEQAQDDAAEVGDTALDEESSAIVVTGTRIRGARVVGEVIELDRETIVETGQVDLGEAIRNLPQNFSGGQNPGVGSGGGIGNENVNSASSPNLRGLGPDATLTLLNGHRLPYNSASQGSTSPPFRSPLSTGSRSSPMELQRSMARTRLAAL